MGIVSPVVGYITTTDGLDDHVALFARRVVIFLRFIAIQSRSLTGSLRLSRFEHAKRVGAPRRSRGRPAADDLSEREMAVLRLMPTQLSLREIGNEMYVSFNTIKTHARNIYARLRVGSRDHAVARARELHLL
jgi:ATP/maltotriose-dependent transcriptional regulator MalT